MLCTPHCVNQFVLLLPCFSPPHASDTGPTNQHRNSCTSANHLRPQHLYRQRWRYQLLQWIHRRSRPRLQPALRRVAAVEPLPDRRLSITGRSHLRDSRDRSNDGRRRDRRSSVYNPQLILRILDPKTNVLLWTTTANVRAAGTQSLRDKGFDESVAVLVDRVRQLTGEQLNATQVKAIRSNSQMPTSMKILLGVGIGAAVGLTIFGVYKVTHMNTPTLPTLPTCPDPPFCPVPAD